MDKYIDRFPDQLLEALTIGASLPDFVFEKPIHNIIISGMGGSGIGGLFVQNYLAPNLPLPITVVNDYNLPATCSSNTLAIFSSYSGNTAETLAAFEQALKTGCTIACVTSGGKLELLAKENALFTVIIPGDMPPRTCLGYSVVAQLTILFKAGLIAENFIDEIKTTVALLVDEKQSIHTIAEQAAAAIKNTIPLIYTDTAINVVGLRLKQQINENAKMFAFNLAIPEMNHNELVAYYNQHKEISVIYLRHEHEHEETARRFSLVDELISEKICCRQTVSATGNSMLANMFYLIHVGDWMSYYLAKINQVDPIKIEMLNWLKTALEKK